MKTRNRDNGNFLCKAVLIHDGIENDFINKANEIKCPHCEGFVIFRLYFSRNFNELDDNKKEMFRKEIRGIKNDSDRKGRYNYKGATVNFCNAKCNFAGHSCTTIFTFQEIQPARYISYLIGLFDSSIINSFD